MDNALTKTIFGNKLNSQMTLKEAINLLTSHDLINIGELAELAISKKSGVELCTKNTPDIDLVSGKQIKHAMVRRAASSDYYKAWISINTTAPILCVITNPVLKEQYYLHIPYEAFKHLDGNSINISFGKDGHSGSSQWWNYQVDSFETLCELAK
jgi:hypothetical protein